MIMLIVWRGVVGLISGYTPNGDVFVVEVRSGYPLSVKEQ